MSLSGQVAVITGASSGIGAAVASVLDDAGVKLVLSARSEGALADVRARLREAEVVAGDIVDPALPQRLIDKALASFGRCDIVFNNAGILASGKIEDIDIEKICLMARVNVEAAYRMAYTALKHFKSVGRGHLLNTSSVVGTKTRPTVGAYAGTKWAIEALSESLRMECARTDIRISCIEPGLVATGLHRDWKQPPAQALGVQNPLTPEDVARVIRFQLEQPPHVRLPRIMILPGEQEI